ncbi:hypothetical protein LX32DRAFT_129992 [Colletotrichum zoysiae]|uniref:Secreted protein n=1 Tax=Colletotrichum zoysiae TaxID=1216348 RepID=A0AAD9HRR9_9PEZI|nr:hypothetical protein LX32DRAFT_129992 [Colletotrichum zoysiae]
MSRPPFSLRLPLACLILSADFWPSTKRSRMDRSPKELVRWQCLTFSAIQLREKASTRDQSITPTKERETDSPLLTLRTHAFPPRAALGIEPSWSCLWRSAPPPSRASPSTTTHNFAIPGPKLLFGILEVALSSTGSKSLSPFPSIPGTPALPLHLPLSITVRLSISRSFGITNR